MQDELPLPEWPKPPREEDASAEVAEFTPVPLASDAQSPFDPVPVQEHRESAEFRVQVGEGGSTEVVPVSQQDSQAETLRSIERHVERLVSLLEDMT